MHHLNLGKLQTGMGGKNTWSIYKCDGKGFKPVKYGVKMQRELNPNKKEKVKPKQDKDHVEMLYIRVISIKAIMHAP